MNWEISTNDLKIRKANEFIDWLNKNLMLYVSDPKNGSDEAAWLFNNELENNFSVSRISYENDSGKTYCIYNRDDSDSEIMNWKDIDFFNKSDDFIPINLNVYYSTGWYVSDKYSDPTTSDLMFTT